MTTPPRLDPIEIFRPGTFVSEEGDEVTVTAADCAAMVAAYDPTTGPAPIVIGHPATDAPAYGWIESMSLGEDDIVRAVPGQVEPGFASDVRAGRYKKVSARFYPPGNRHNPNPGVFSLRHVGALGAHPPAVKGLKNLSFAEGSGESGLTFDQDIAARAATNPTDTTTQTETQPTKEAEVAEKKDEKDADAISFAEARDQLAKDQAKVAEDRAAIVADRTELEKRATDASHKANVSFVEGAVAAAKIANSAKEQFVFLLDRLSASPADISFGEGEKKQSPADLLKSLITAANPLVSFGEFAKDEGAGKGKMSAMSLSAKASKYQAEQKALGNIISTAQAVRHVEMEMA